VVSGLRLRRDTDGNETVHKIFSNDGHIQYFNGSGNRGHQFFTNNGIDVAQRMILNGKGQLGLGGSVTSSAIMQLTSIDKGFLLPSMTEYSVMPSAARSPVF